MERDTFIIAIYCCIADLIPVLMKDNRLRQGGFSPQLSDAEFITIEVYGEFLKLSTDKCSGLHLKRSAPALDAICGQH